MPIGHFTITNKSGTPLSAGFYPGQVIEGIVNLTVTDEHMKCKGTYAYDLCKMFGSFESLCPHLETVLQLEIHATPDTYLNCFFDNILPPSHRGRHMCMLPQGIRLEITGKGRVAWSETTGTGKKETTQRYTEDETFVDHVRYLKGSGESEQDEVTLPVGQLQVGSNTLNKACTRLCELPPRHTRAWALDHRTYGMPF